MLNDVSNLETAFKNGKDYKPYISSIVFPNYKNIDYKSEITFEFSLTLLIGRNGTNKSSILHALYGCPDGKSTGEYWFSMHTDPIDTRDGRRAAFFYRYTIPETGETAEVLKTRIKKEKDSDYWEPSRPVLDYGMQPMPQYEGQKTTKGRSKTRWNAIKKDVLYLDFRSEISAFDKAFYKTVGSRYRIQHRNKLRKQSKPLKESIEKNLKTRKYYQKERIVENYQFTKSQIDIVNNILGTDYSHIVYIEHDFYMSGSFSVYISKYDESNYSEEFAGSGETSVIRLVYALDSAYKKSLILLDEPETSLHIEAQYRLKDFIIEKIKEKKLQVVISTHSPFFAPGLPESAIKVLYPDEVSKKIRIINSAPADESSFHLGYTRTDASKSNIVLEDKLARALAMHVSNKILSDIERDRIILGYFPGGNSGLLNAAAAEMLKENSNMCFLFDGDQQPQNGIPDPDTIPPSENDNLKTIVKNTFGVLPAIPYDSNNENQRIELLRRYLKFARERFRYLPCQCPEEFIIQNHGDFTSENIDNPKSHLADFAKRKLESSGEVNAQEILFFQRNLLSDIPIETLEFHEIAAILKEFARYAS